MEPEETAAQAPQGKAKYFGDTTLLTNTSNMLRDIVNSTKAPLTFLQDLGWI